MSSKKYRLAAPTDNNNNVTVLKQPIVSIYLPRLSMPNDVTLGSRPLIENNRKKVKKASPNSSPYWWAVLPCLLLIMLVSAADPLFMNDLIVRRYERYYGLSSSSSAQREACRQSATTSAPIMPSLYWEYPFINQNPPDQHPDYSLVQRDAANFNVKNSIAALIPAVVTFILLGSNSDIVGRRPLLVLPFLGKVVRYTLLLIVVSRDLSDAWLIATNTLEAIFGSNGLVVLSGFAYITDCTDETRTRSFFVAEVVMIIARVVPILAISIWLRHHLYIVPLSIGLALSVMGLLYALLVQPESVEAVKKMSFIQQLLRIRLKPIIHVITVFTVKRQGYKRQWLILLTIVTIFLLFILYGYTAVFPLYLYGKPLCLDAFNVGLLSLAQVLTIIPFALLIVLCKKAFDKTYFLPLLGTVTLIIGLIIFSLAKKLWLLYIGACIGSLFFLALPILRTKLTKVVEENEYAIVFIGAGIIETLGHDAVGAVANRIYKSSLQFFPGLVFIILAIIGVFPLAIMCYLTFSEARNNKNENSKSVSRKHFSKV